MLKSCASKRINNKISLNLSYICIQVKESKHIYIYIYIDVWGLGFENLVRRKGSKLENKEKWKKVKGGGDYELSKRRRKRKL